VYLPDQPELELISVQALDRSSSPKYHAQPIGLFVERSVKVTGSGDIPVVGLELKSATGAAAEATDENRISMIIPEIMCFISEPPEIIFSF
jgi:hypothetical protein